MYPKIVLSVPRGLMLKTDLFEDMAFAKKAGYDGLDYVSDLKDLFVFPKQVLQEAKRLKIPIQTLHQPLPLIIYTPSFVFGRMIHLAKQFPDLVTTNHHLSGVINIKKNPEQVKKLLELGKNNAVQFSFEINPKEAGFYPKETHIPDEFSSFMKKHKFPMTLDTSHISTYGYNIVDFFKRNYDSIELIHLSDFHNGKQHLPLGEGSLPLKEFFSEIKKKKWNKTIIFEIGNMPKGISSEERYKKIKKSLDLARKYLA